MRKILFHFVIAGCLFFVSSTVNATTLEIPGTGDGVAVLNALAAGFKLDSGSTVEIPKSVGSSGGIVMAGSDQAEIARVARTIKDKEKHFNLTYKPIFKVPTVFFVSSDVKVPGLTEEQVLAIFSGKITNWNAVGGPDKKIKVFVREEGDSSFNNLKKTFPGFKDIAFTQKAITARKTYEMVTFVKYEKDAIGFGPLDVALANDLHYVKIDGVAPEDTDYKFFGTIGLVYKPQNLSGTAKKFLDYVSSENSAVEIAKFGGMQIR